jgi:uncharacterized protein YjbJ (UPF0337 family)
VHYPASNYDQLSAIRSLDTGRYKALQRQENFPKEALTCSQTVKAQGTIHGPQRIEDNHRTEERIMMKPSTADKVTGKLHEVKGAIRQKAGELTSNPNLAAGGRAEKNAGKVQNVVGKIEKAVGE